MATPTIRQITIEGDGAYDLEDESARLRCDALEEEIIAARTGTDGTVYESLEERLNAEISALQKAIKNI